MPAPARSALRRRWRAASARRRGSDPRGARARAPSAHQPRRPGGEMRRRAPSSRGRGGAASRSTAVMLDGFGQSALLGEDVGEVQVAEVVAGGDLDHAAEDALAVAPGRDLRVSGESTSDERRDELRDQRAVETRRPQLRGGLCEAPDDGDDQSNRREVGVAIGGSLLAGLQQTGDGKQAEHPPAPAHREPRQAADERDGSARDREEEDCGDGHVQSRPTFGGERIERGETGRREGHPQVRLVSHHCRRRTFAERHRLELRHRGSGPRAQQGADAGGGAHRQPRHLFEQQRSQARHQLAPRRPRRPRRSDAPERPQVEQQHQRRHDERRRLAQDGRREGDGDGRSSVHVTALRASARREAALTTPRRRTTSPCGRSARAPARHAAGGAQRAAPPPPPSRRARAPRRPASRGSTAGTPARR